MAILPDESLSLLVSLAPVFTQPTYQRFLVLLGAAILTTGRRNVANLLRTAASLAPGHVSSYRRVFSKAHWSMIRLACALT
jgi:DDE superfamily endonuclease